MKTKEILKRPSQNNNLHHCIILAALTHDLGHGPFSHLLDHCHFMDRERFVEDYKNQDKYIYSQDIANYFSARYSKESIKRVDHEDLTIAYLSYIFKYLAQSDEFFADDHHLRIVCALVSKDFRKYVLDDEVNLLTDEEKEFAVVFGEMISGFIDVDRLDYTLRDSMMAGVNFGQIELPVLLRDLVPLLTVKNGELIGSLAGQFKYHANTDHFIFNLFELYSQVIHHPKAIEMNYEMEMLLTALKSRVLGDMNQIRWHANSNDQRVIEQLREEEAKLKIEAPAPVDVILHRSKGLKSDAGDKLKSIYCLPRGHRLPSVLVTKGYTQIEIERRKIIKDGTRIWLTAQQGKLHVQIFDWRNVSSIATRLSDHSFDSQFWWKNDEFTEHLDEIEAALQRTASGSLEPTSKVKA